MAETLSFKKYKEISKAIKKLTQEKRYEEALELCTEENCKQDIVIQTQKINILELLGHKIAKEKDTNIVLTKIYFNNIEIAELNSQSMELWEKVILHIAYYEKHNKKTGLEWIKKSMIQMDLTKEQKKILNILKERLSSKKNIIFDCGLYCEILNCTIDFQYVPTQTEKSLAKGTTIKTTKKQAIIKKEASLKKETKPKIVGQEGKRINRYNNHTNNFATNAKKVETVLLIKDVFEKELFEIKKYVYWEMNWGKNRLGATRVWDTLECLEMKDARDEYAYQKMLHIIEICVSNQVIQLETQNTRKLENHNKK